MLNLIIDIGVCFSL